MKKRFYDSMKLGNYEGLSDAKVQENADGNLIPSASNQNANMPQNVIMKTFPLRNSAMPENYGDSMKGIDKQINSDMATFKKVMKK